MVDEEPFPTGSVGPQCVPTTPTLANNFHELHGENNFSEWPWQLPNLHSGENGVVDLFKDYHQAIIINVLWKLV